MAEVAKTHTRGQDVASSPSIDLGLGSEIGIMQKMSGCGKVS